MLNRVTNQQTKHWNCVAEVKKHIKGAGKHMIGGALELNFCQPKTGLEFWSLGSCCCFTFFFSLRTLSAGKFFWLARENVFFFVYLSSLFLFVHLKFRSFVGSIHTYVLTIIIVIVIITIIIIIIIEMRFRSISAIHLDFNSCFQFHSFLIDMTFISFSV